MLLFQFKGLVTGRQDDFNNNAAHKSVALGTFPVRNAAIKGTLTTAFDSWMPRSKLSSRCQVREVLSPDMALFLSSGFGVLSTAPKIHRTKNRQFLKKIR